MQVDKDDWVIIPGINNKNNLVQVTAFNKTSKIYTGIVDNGVRGTEAEATLDFEKEDILAILAKSPTVGKVYGVKVEPFYTLENIKPWGEIRYHRHLTDGEKNFVRKLLAYTGRIIHNSGLIGFLPITVEIRNKSGKDSGFYYFRRKAGAIDSLSLQPEAIDNTLYYILMHEFAHHLWFRHYDDSLRSKWINLYHKTVKLEEIGKDKLTQLYRDFIKSRLFIAQYAKSLKDTGDEEGLLLFKTVIKFIIKIHFLSVRHINIMLNQQQNIGALWPTTPMQLSQVAKVISDYGKKNAEEYHSDAFSYLCIGNPLPQEIVNALTYSVRYINGTLPILVQNQQAA